MRARSVYVESDRGEAVRAVAFDFPFLAAGGFPFYLALKGRIQLQLLFAACFSDSFGTLAFQKRFENTAFRCRRPFKSDLVEKTLCDSLPDFGHPSQRPSWPPSTQVEAGRTSINKLPINR